MRIIVGLMGMLACSIGGCADLPIAGPASDAIEAQDTATLSYFLTPLTVEAVAILDQAEPKGLAGAFTDRQVPTSLTFGVGDILSVTVFEAAAGGLFIPSEAGVRPGNFVSLPDQAVDNGGNITVPYAGTIRARGRTNVEVQNAIIQRLKDRAIEPQVVVALASQRTNLISVIGEVNSPVRFAAAASGAGDRISDALTRAGGIKGQGFETWVMLERAGRRATVPFENLIMTPSNNIYVQPGDRLYVYREPQRFIAFGAEGRQGEFNFDAWRINLAEAVAKAGGLQDAQAAARSVYLYRQEPKDVAARLGAPMSKFPGETVPVVFHVDFSDPGGYFLATRTTMRNQDILFAANAKDVEIGKALQFLNLATTNAANTAFVASATYAARADALIK